VIDRPDPAGFSFASLTCEVAHPGGGPAWCRLVGRSRDDRSLLLDFAGGHAEPPLPPRLEAVRIEPDPSDPARWQLSSAGGRYEISAARLFVHEDVAARAVIVIPPRPVPRAKRMFWRLVFVLLATPLGRRWLERRVASA